ncbi:TetR family transcriptional regulator (plasmid) [Bryobacterales bacterium F-183]|nr:TetR family transcriptional regulator [Bryobacterales bacterium F-183]
MILDEAAALIEEQGLDALSMRVLAARLEVRASSLYRYFSDREQLESALGDRAAEELRMAMDLAIEGKNPADAFAAAAEAYRAFAKAKPGAYAVLHRNPAATEPRKRLWLTVLGLVGRLTGDADDTSAAVATWSYLHGFCTLEASGLFGASGPKEGFRRGVATFANGLRASRKDH